MPIWLRRYVNRERETCVEAARSRAQFQAGMASGMLAQPRSTIAATGLPAGGRVPGASILS